MNDDIENVVHSVKTEGSRIIQFLSTLKQEEITPSVVNTIVNDIESLFYCNDEVEISPVGNKRLKLDIASNLAGSLALVDLVNVDQSIYCTLERTVYAKLYREIAYRKKKREAISHSRAAYFEKISSQRSVTLAKQQSVEGEGRDWQNLDPSTFLHSDDGRNRLSVLRNAGSPSVGLAREGSPNLIGPCVLQPQVQPPVTVMVCAPALDVASISTSAPHISAPIDDSLLQVPMITLGQVSRQDIGERSFQQANQPVQQFSQAKLSTQERLLVEPPLSDVDQPQSNTQLGNVARPSIELMAGSSEMQRPRSHPSSSENEMAFRHARGVYVPAVLADVSEEEVESTATPAVTLAADQITNSVPPAARGAEITSAQAVLQAPNLQVTFESEILQNLEPISLSQVPVRSGRAASRIRPIIDQETLIQDYATRAIALNNRVHPVRNLDLTTLDAKRYQHFMCVRRLFSMPGCSSLFKPVYNKNLLKLHKRHFVTDIEITAAIPRISATVPQVPIPPQPSMVPEIPTTRAPSLVPLVNLTELNFSIDETLAGIACEREVTPMVLPVPPSSISGPSAPYGVAPTDTSDETRAQLKPIATTSKSLTDGNVLIHTTTAKILGDSGHIDPIVTLTTPAICANISTDERLHFVPPATTIAPATVSATTTVTITSHQEAIPLAETSLLDHPEPISVSASARPTVSTPPVLMSVTAAPTLLVSPLISPQKKSLVESCQLSILAGAPPDPLSIARNVSDINLETTTSDARPHALTLHEQAPLEVSIPHPGRNSAMAPPKEQWKDVHRVQDILEQLWDVAETKSVKELLGNDATQGDHLAIITTMLRLNGKWLVRLYKRGQDLWVTGFPYDQVQYMLNECLI